MIFKGGGLGLFSRVLVWVYFFEVSGLGLFFKGSGLGLFFKGISSGLFLRVVVWV